MKCLVKILAVLGAIAAIGAVLYCLRDKLKALCPCCKTDFQPVAEDDPAEDVPVAAPEAEETAAEETAPAVGEAAEEPAVEEAAEEPAEAPAEDAASAEDFVD